MVSIGREDMPDNTPEDILKELDSILEKQEPSAQVLPESKQNNTLKNGFLRIS